MDSRLLIDSAVLAGEIMLRNGAETYLVEETINKILKTNANIIKDSQKQPPRIIITFNVNPHKM